MTSHTEPRANTQTAPYPAELDRLVGQLRYRRHMGWKVWLEDDYQRDPPETHGAESRGLTLIVQRRGPDAYHPERTMKVNHYFAVPPATYNRRSWMRWLFDRLADVDTHERMEDFVLELPPHNRNGLDGIPNRLVRPYAPAHSPGNDPYAIRELGTVADAETSFRGERKEGSQSHGQG